MLFDRALVSIAACSTVVVLFSAYCLRFKPHIVYLTLIATIFAAFWIFGLVIGEQLIAVPFILYKRLFDGSEKRFLLLVLLVFNVFFLKA